MTRLDPEDHQLFAHTIERLAQKHHGLAASRSLALDCADGCWEEFCQQGVMGIGIDPANGGVGGGAADLVMVMRHLGRNLLTIPYLDRIVVPGSLVQSLGSDDQKRALLPAIADGSKRLVLAHREQDGGDLDLRVVTTVRHGRLSGTKLHVIEGETCDGFLVTATDEGGDAGVWLVDRQAAQVRSYRLPDDRLAAQVTFIDSPGEALGGNAAQALGRLWNYASLCVAAEAFGAAEALNQLTLEHAKFRRQFGVPIGSFQVLQHRMVDMFIAERTVGALVGRAALALDAEQERATLLSSAAAAVAIQSARRIGESAIQIHGGMGMTDECAVGHYLKRILTIGSLFGTPAWHMARVASLTANGRLGLSE